MASIRGAQGSEYSLVDKRRKCRSLVKQVLDYAIRMGAINGINTAERTTAPPKTKTQPRALTVTKIHTPRQAVRAWGGPHPEGQRGPAPSPEASRPWSTCCWGPGCGSARR